MIISISEAKAHLSSLIQQLIEEKEDVIYISKNGKPIAQLTLIRNQKKQKNWNSEKGNERL